MKKKLKKKVEIDFESCFKQNAFELDGLDGGLPTLYLRSRRRLRPYVA